MIRKRAKKELCKVPEITAITPQIKDKKRCNIFIDGRFYCGLLLETAIKNQLKAGRKIDVNELSRLQLESEKNVALDKALTFISLTRKTEKQVRDFLAGKGYLADVIEYVVEKMSGYKFLDDGDYAKAYVEQTATKKGSRLIKLELKAKGVDEQEIEDAFDGVKEDTQIETAKRILQKYMRGKCADRETLAKSFRYLLGKGFEYDVAKSAISAYGECDDE
jgi:regulatory protein